MVRSSDCHAAAEKLIVEFFLPAVTQHNLVFQARLMGRARDAILEDTFPNYLKTFFAEYFGNKGYPEWCVNALRCVGVDLLEGRDDVRVIPGGAANWDRPDRER